MTLVSVLFEDLLRCDLYFLLLNHVSIIADEADHCVLVRPLFHDCLVPSKQLLYLQHTRHVVKNDECLLVAEVLRQLPLQLVKSILLHPKDIRSKCAYEYALDLGFIIETQFNPELVNVVTSNHASLHKNIMSPL